MTQPQEESAWRRLVKMVRANFKFDIQGLRDWLEGQGHLSSDLPSNWDPVWTDSRGKDQPEDWEKRLGAAAHVALPGHGWIVEGAAPSSVKCRLCGVATAIWLCSMAAAEADKDLEYVTVFAGELGKIRSLVDQAQRRYVTAAGEYREQHIPGIRRFLERAKATAASAMMAEGAKAAPSATLAEDAKTAPSTRVAKGEKAAGASATSVEGRKAAAPAADGVQGEEAAAPLGAASLAGVEGEKAAATAASSTQGAEAARYFEERLRNVGKGTTVGLMDALDIDSMFKSLGTVLQGLQNDVLVDTRNPGYAEPGAVAKGHPVSLRTRVERCLRAAGFTDWEIGEKLIRSVKPPVGAKTDSEPYDGRSNAEKVRDRTSPRRHPRRR